MCEAEGVMEREKTGGYQKVYCNSVVKLERSIQDHKVNQCNLASGALPYVCIAVCMKNE